MLYMVFRAKLGRQYEMPPGPPREVAPPEHDSRNPRAGGNVLAITILDDRDKLPAIEALTVHTLRGSGC